MKKYNEYNTYSGGYIFAAMDEWAHDILKDSLESDGIKPGCLFTSHGAVDYEKQCCKGQQFVIGVDEIRKVHGADNEWVVFVKITSLDQQITYARGNFTFVAKEHGYCQKSV